MKTRRFLLMLICCLLGLFALSACGDSAETVTMLNTVTEFYCDGVRLEATARELTVSGGEATARIRVTNRGEEPISGFTAFVTFLDAEGNALYTDETAVQFEVAMEIGESTSLAAKCSGSDVKKITAVKVSAPN